MKSCEHKLQLAVVNRTTETNTVTACIKLLLKLFCILAPLIPQKARANHGASAATVNLSRHVAFSRVTSESPVGEGKKNNVILSLSQLLYVRLMCIVLALMKDVNSQVYDSAFAEGGSKTHTFFGDLFYFLSLSPGSRSS